MSVIYKYPIAPSNEVQSLELPSSSEILSAIAQDGQIVLYAFVPDPEARPVWNCTKRLLVVGTGWEFEAPSILRFINSVQTGIFVWHVFEVVESKVDGSE